MGKIREYLCANCNSTFVSNKGCVTRSPKFCSRKCSALFNGKKPEVKAKFSAAKIGLEPWNKGIKMWEDREHPRGTLNMKFPHRSGEKCHLWRGGVSSENELARKSPEYREWRTSVFERDNYTCVECGVRGGKLHADHILPFAYYHELRLEITNGRTLCVKCHYKTDTYGSKALKYEVQKNIRTA